MVVAKKFVFVKQYDGLPTNEHFQLAEEEIPNLGNGDFLVEAVYFSVDPYLRLHSVEVGQTMHGTQVAKIIESNSSKFPVGKYVVGEFGWRTHTTWTDHIPRISWDTPHLLPYDPSESAPLSLALGVLGMPGHTAYFGLFDVCLAKPGETVAVTAAGGAVGSIVGQLAKIIGCTVIGFVGSDDKVEWTRSLGFDHIINYKKENIQETLKSVAPRGIDCYFDNVGGELSSIIMKQMNIYGRVAVCGAISAYNSQDSVPLAKMIQLSVALKRLRIRAFHVNEFLNRYQESTAQLLKWIQEGKLQYRETITEGFENMGQAFIDMLNGKNVGKAIVKV